MRKRILLAGENQPLWEEFYACCRQSPEEWWVETTKSGLDGLELFRQEPFDAVVTDVQLLDTNGLSFLDDVMKLRPETVRIVLSDITDTASTVLCVGQRHRHLLKQNGARMLFEAVSEALEGNIWLPGSKVQELVSRMSLVPSPPGVYFQMVEEMQSDDASIERIGSLIAEDPAITAKILQLANSVVFGLQLQVTRPIEAIAYLGLETVKALVLLAHTFSSVKQPRVLGFSMESLWHHSVFTGRFARQIAQAENSRPAYAEQASAGGLLHDLGKLLFVANIPDEFSKILAHSRDNKCRLWESELEIVGATHAEVGAALLSVWGLPGTIVEAVALHHQPISVRTKQFNTVTAVHAANVLAHEAWPEAPAPVTSQLDEEYLKGLGLDQHTDIWRKRCLPEFAEV